MINGNNIEAKSQKEKLSLLTNIWSSVYEISPQENRKFCSKNEKKVASHLLNIADKVTSKFKINVNELENKKI